MLHDAPTLIKLQPEDRDNGWSYIVWQNEFPNARIKSPEGNWYELFDDDADSLLTICFPRYEYVSLSHEALKTMIDIIVDQQQDLFSVCFKPLFE